MVEDGGKPLLYKGFSPVFHTPIPRNFSIVKIAQYRNAVCPSEEKAKLVIALHSLVQRPKGNLLKTNSL